MFSIMEACIRVDLHNYVSRLNYLWWFNHTPNHSLLLYIRIWLSILTITKQPYWYCLTQTGQTRALQHLCPVCFCFCSYSICLRTHTHTHRRGSCYAVWSLRVKHMVYVCLIVCDLRGSPFALMFSYSMRRVLFPQRPICTHTQYTATNLSVFQSI